ncbi:unnamed protein product [Porites lobata]|uniref:Uncharacterized protein n=1 Tax=Porites lobata TaxID=104759 RepID=A0ABN8NDF4_9CNID|nr:unnamed protein product [Porites lobata]
MPDDKAELVDGAENVVSREQPERPEHQSSPSTSGTSSNEPNVRAQNSFFGVSEGLCCSTGAGAPSIGLAVVLAYDIPRQTDVDRWAYLNGIHIPHIDAEIELLVGNDPAKVLEPKEIRESKDGVPSTVRTLFG